jgi:para-nitrobenzyl esterase
LLAAPRADGLFQKAIVQSGAQSRSPYPVDAADTTNAFLRALGEPDADLARIRALPGDQLVAAAANVMEEFGLLAFQPVVDGSQQTTQPWSSRSSVGVRIPLLIGTTRDETAPFYPGAASGHIVNDASAAQELLSFPFTRDSCASLDEAMNIILKYRGLYPDATSSELMVTASTDIWMVLPTYNVISARLKLGATKTFVYEFEWKTPCFGSSWACHAAELPFIFGSREHGSAWDGEDDDALRAAADPSGQRFELADDMMAAWAAFATRGDPSIPRFEWPAYSARNHETALLGSPTGSQVQNGPLRSRIAIVEHLRPGW